MNKFWKVIANESSCFLFVLLGFSPTILSNAKIINNPPINEFIGSAYAEEGVVFTPTGNMNTARWTHSAILLNNGMVLVAGGNDGYDTAELYNPSTGTWSYTGNMIYDRENFSLTLLNDGKVLATGGTDGIHALSSAEIYDPVNGTWSETGSMNFSRAGHLAILLTDGKVLVAGGNYGGTTFTSTELYNPATGIWSPTGGLHYLGVGRGGSLLTSGNVLVAGGDLIHSEFYNPITGNWTVTGNLNSPRGDVSTILLPNGNVLVTGGGLTTAELYNPTNEIWNNTRNSHNEWTSNTVTLLNNGQVLFNGGGCGKCAELFFPSTETWLTTYDMTESRALHTATLFNDGKILIAGGKSGSIRSSAEIGTVMPGNFLTGTLVLPSGWLNSQSTSLQIRGNSSDAAINAGALSNNRISWGDWISLSPGVFTNTTWNVGDGEDVKIYLRLRDENGVMAEVVTGTIDIDSAVPTASIDPLDLTQSSFTFAVNWSGSDATSGIKDFDVQYKDGSGAWTDWQMATPSLTANFTGEEDHTYYFRVRARDNAGNLSGYSATNIQTTVDVYPFDLYLPVIDR